MSLSLEQSQEERLTPRAVSSTAAANRPVQDGELPYGDYPYAAAPGALGADRSTGELATDLRLGPGYGNREKEGRQQGKVQSHAHF